MGCNCGSTGIKDKLLKIAATLEKKGDVREGRELKKSIAQYDRAMRKLTPTKK